MSDGTYLIADAARMRGAIHHARELNPDHTCLYEGDSERFLSSVAPWLFTLERGGPFASWVADAGSRENWGIVLRCTDDPVHLYKHLRNHLIVQAEDGTDLYFRYYDPRVLRSHLPQWRPGELKAFFGPISVLAAEDAGGEVVEYSLRDNGALTTSPTKMTLGEYLGVAEALDVDPTTDTGPQRVKGTWDFGY